MFTGTEAVWKSVEELESVTGSYCNYFVLKEQLMKENITCIV
jgi:hypothetical protein